MQRFGPGPSRRTVARGLAAATAAMAAGALSAQAAGEVRVLSGGAAKAALGPAIAAFEAAAGAKVVAEFAPMGRLKAALAGGATPDVIVVTEEVLAEIAPKGWVVADTATLVGRVGIGVAVRDSAAVPDISTPDAFKATLLKARSIVMIDPAIGTSGRHLAKVMADLGIAEALKPKLTYLKGGYVVEPVGRGEIEIGLHQITEILPVKGVKLAGPLPAPLQKVTVYKALVGSKAADPALARRLLATLQMPAVRAAIAKAGYMSDSP